MDPEEQEEFVFAIPEGEGEEGEEFIINILPPEEGFAILNADGENAP